MGCVKNSKNVCPECGNPIRLPAIALPPADPSFADFIQWLAGRATDGRYLVPDMPPRVPTLAEAAIPLINPPPRKFNIPAHWLRMGVLDVETPLPRGLDDPHEDLFV